VEEVKEETKTAPVTRDALTKTPLPPQPAAQPKKEMTIGEKMDAMTAANPHQARTDIDKSISTYNGGTTQKYKWSQQIFNVDVQIKLPSGTKARQIICTIKTKHLKVMIKG